MNTMVDTYTCSYCPSVATHEGDRQLDGTLDADFYCTKHKSMAPGMATPITTCPPECEAKVDCSACGEWTCEVHDEDQDARPCDVDGSMHETCWDDHLAACPSCVSGLASEGPSS